MITFFLFIYLYNLNRLRIEIKYLVSCEFDPRLVLTNGIDCGNVKIFENQ